MNDAIRTPGAFEQATRNIRLLARLKRERNAEEPWIGVHAVVTSLNHEAIDELVAMTHELGGRYFGVVHLRTAGGHLETFRLRAAQHDAFLQSVRRDIRLAEKLGVGTNLWTVLPPAEQMGLHRPAPVGDGRFSDAACFEPWIGMGILAEGGRAGPCSAFWDAGAGSVNEQSLADLWRGPYLREVRARVLSGKGLPPYCLECPSFFHGLREELRHGLVAWEHAQWREGAWHRRAEFAAKRFLSSLRRRGLRQTVRRTREWIQIRMR